jgi:hypothetical protein
VTESTGPAAPDPGASAWEYAARWFEREHGAAPPPGDPLADDGWLAALAYVRATMTADPAAYQDLRTVTRDDREHVMTGLIGLACALVQDVAGREHVTPVQLIDRIVAATIRRAAQ